MNVVVTGGAGFLGSALTREYLLDGDAVTILDSLSRGGSAANLSWLMDVADYRPRIVLGDVRSESDLAAAVTDADLIFHLAAQSAPSAAIRHPRDDFETNVVGTLNVLEAARRSDRSPIVVFASSRHVYGDLDNLPLVAHEDRYQLAGVTDGIDESWPLVGQSPFSCSKGAADQYVRDYARCFGLRTVVLRLSSVYGPQQRGRENQGWVSRCAESLVAGRPIVIHGDERQVCDLLYVDDAVRAFRLAVDRIAVAAGRAYNIGGGARNALSVLQVLRTLVQITRRDAAYTTAGWRAGDQAFYVSDIRRAARDLGWAPTVSAEAGLAKLCAWALQRHRTEPDGGGATPFPHRQAVLAS